MDKANVLPVSHIFIHAAAKMYPDLTQPLCLTVWLKKRKEKKKEKKGRLKEETSSCKDMRKKARRKLAGHYKSYIFLSLLFAIAPKYKRYGKHHECLARLLSVRNKCHRQAAGFNIFSGSHFLSLYRGGLSTWLDKHLQIMGHLAQCYTTNRQQLSKWK